MHQITIIRVQTAYTCKGRPPPYADSEPSRPTLTVLQIQVLNQTVRRLYIMFATREDVENLLKNYPEWATSGRRSSVFISMASRPLPSRMVTPNFSSSSSQ